MDMWLEVKAEIGSAIDRDTLMDLGEQILAVIKQNESLPTLRVILRNDTQNGPMQRWIANAISILDQLDKHPERIWITKHGVQVHTQVSEAGVEFKAVNGKDIHFTVTTATLDGPVTARQFSQESIEKAIDRITRLTRI